MERCWFAGKRCLDVGCNAGLVSLAVAARFGTGAMLGLDIDPALVHQASVNLSRCPCRLRGLPTFVRPADGCLSTTRQSVSV